MSTWPSSLCGRPRTIAPRLQTILAARCASVLLCRQVPEGYTVLTEGQASILQSGNSVFYNPVQASPSVQATMSAFGSAAPHWLHPEAKALAAVWSCQSLSKCVKSSSLLCHSWWRYMSTGAALFAPGTRLSPLSFRGWPAIL